MLADPWVRFQYCEDDNSKLICHIKTMQVILPAGFLIETNKLILKFVWTYEEPRIDKTILRKNKVEDFHNLITELV